MPEPAICQELQLSRTQSPVKCSDGIALAEKQLGEKLQECYPREPSNVHSEQTHRCIAHCPGSVSKNIEKSNENECSGENVNVKVVEDNCETEDAVDGPLGQIPGTSEGSVPAEYWAPLADLTKSRPAVENYSTTRYSPAEWHLRNDRLLKTCHESVDKELSTSFKAHRSMERVFAQTDKDQQDNNIKLNARLSFVGRWKTELQREIAEFTKEINSIQEERKRLMRCSHALTLVESINRDVKKVRCLRMECELVRDEVDDELSNESDLCADIRNVYVRYLDQIKMQLQELKDGKRRLEIDLTDKKEAWNIDVTCRGLDSKSSLLEWKAGSVQVPADQSTPTSYENYCKDAIATSQECLQRSKILRLNLHDNYDKSVHDLRTQADRVDIVLTKKIDEIVQICRRLENELNQCLKALSDAEALIAETRAGTKRLDGAMKCAQTRLDLRSRRSNVENCRDVPQFGLIDEVKTLSEGVSSMLSQIKNASSAVDELTKAREKLEKDLVAKQKSLWVDRERCQILRSFYPTIQTLAGH